MCLFAALCFENQAVYDLFSDHQFIVAMDIAISLRSLVSVTLGYVRGGDVRLGQKHLNLKTVILVCSTVNLNSESVLNAGTVWRQL